MNPPKDKKPVTAILYVLVWAFVVQTNPKSWSSYIFLSKYSFQLRLMALKTRKGWIDKLTMIDFETTAKTFVTDI